MTAQCSVRVVTEGRPPVLSVTGELDATNATEFEARVRGLVDDEGVVDLGGLDYCDSAGFAALDRLLATVGVALVIGPDSPVRKAATLMGVVCFDDLPGAIASLGASAEGS